MPDLFKPATAGWLLTVARQSSRDWDRFEAVFELAHSHQDGCFRRSLVDWSRHAHGLERRTLRALARQQGGIG